MRRVLFLFALLVPADALPVLSSGVDSRPRPQHALRPDLVMFAHVLTFSWSQEALLFPQLSLDPLKTALVDATHAAAYARPIPQTEVLRRFNTCPAPNCWVQREVCVVVRVC